jgi:hypothetical protein
MPAEMPPIGGHGGSSRGSSHGGMQPMDDLIEYATSYARERPGTAALWCLGIGFILGWKLKPW